LSSSLIPVCGCRDYRRNARLVNGLRRRADGFSSVVLTRSGRSDRRAGGAPEDHRRSQEAGFDAHLVKPVDPARLVAVIAATAAR
jgi:CheY-like chemotaxis protein